jgi:hypothetical protein
MRYSVIRTTIDNIVISRTASARDVINAWWAVVERERITDPNILCLSRDPEAFDIDYGSGNQVEIDDDVEIFIKPLNKTSPEVVGIDLTWDGHDMKGQSFRRTIPAKVYREAPRSQLLNIWIEHHKVIREYAEIDSHLFTDENEYNWTEESKAAPP